MVNQRMIFHTILKLISFYTMQMSDFSGEFRNNFLSYRPCPEYNERNRKKSAELIELENTQVTIVRTSIRDNSFW